MHMHLHTCHQPGASMESHIYNASCLGMNYIRFTDHDTRTGRKCNAFDSFDFSRGELEYKYSGGAVCSLQPIGDIAPYFEDGELVLDATSREDEHKIVGVQLVTSGKNHTVSLLAEVILRLGLTFKASGDARVVFDIRLSERPPEHKPAHYRYVFGDVRCDKNPLCREVAIAEREDGMYTLDLSSDIGKCTELGGLDNVFDTVSILLEVGDGGSISAKLRHLEIEAKYGYNDVTLRQRKLADEIGARYGIKPFVTTEISAAGQHKNIFSECVPTINYEELGYKVTESEAIAHVKRWGGIFAYNHPFESDKYKRRDFTRAEVDNIVISDAQTLIASRVYGATMMEVGFPEGRGYFELSDHLRLWDLLSLAGVFITGYGDSDSHNGGKGWLCGNNFASWIAAPKDMLFPVPESVFIDSMKAGRVYMGDPTRLRARIDFRAGDTLMGGIIPIYDNDTRSREMTFTASGIDPKTRVRIVVDGRELINEVCEGGGEYSKAFEVAPEHTVSFARVELYGGDGRCILLTNPIYLVRVDEIAAEIPEERVYYSWTIDIPEEAESIKGKKLLHIGDTDSRLYPYYKKLIETVKPDIILHTGDMADEVKVGRIPETRFEYLRKIEKIIGYMRASGARVIIVPGNNDLPDEIKKIAPDMEVYHRNSVIVLDGEECRIGHQVMNMTFDKKWHFYGHGFTGEEWSYEKNVPGEECRFNACLGSFICSISENKFYMLPIPKIKKC